MAVIGTVSGSWLFLVKSMLGEAVDRLDVGSTGVVGDRAAALIDRATGKVASAKLPYRWRRLLEFRSRLLDGTDARGWPLMEQELPDGVRPRSDLPDIDGRLPAAVGREVALAFARTASLQINRTRPEHIAERDFNRAVLPDNFGRDMSPVLQNHPRRLNQISGAAALAEIASSAAG